MTFKKAGLLAALSFCLLPALRAQQKVVFIFGDLTVRAWTMDKGENGIVASGEVEVVYKQIKLFADRVELETKTKDVLATGQVSLQLPEEVVNCEKLSFNLDTQQGKLAQAIGRIQPSVLYEASSIERKSDNLYTLEKASFTSCTQPTPRWKFSFSKANFKKDDYVEMWNAVLSIKKIPIFYWPYLRYPLDKQPRATGFLTPKIGYSKAKGFSLSQGFYWAIARNMDASFSLDYYAAKGVGGGAEYRYLFNGGTSGDVHLYYFIFKQLPDQTVKTPDAYIIRWNHNQQLPLGFRLVASVDYQSSFTFLKEFDNNFMRALIFNRISQIYVAKSWSSYSFSARAAQVETGSSLYKAFIINKYFPEISFDSFKMKILSPLYFSFSSNFRGWQYGWDYQYVRNTQIKNQEFTFGPVLSLPFNAIPWLNTNFTLEGYMKYSWRSYKSGTRTIVDEPVLAKSFTFSVEMIGPVLYRIWNIGGDDGVDGSNATRLKHIIEPSVSYRYDSPLVNGLRVIAAYPIYLYHQLTYSLTNHLFLKKGAGTPQEIFTWGISQSYYLSPEDSPMANYPVDGQIPRFSEVDSFVRWYPGAGYSFDFAASYNTYFKSFSSIRLAANLGSPADNLFLNVNWFKSMNPYYNNPFFNRHQISLYSGVRIPAISLELQGESDFNISEMKMLYSAVSLVYHYQCLDIKADVRLFFYREKPDMQFKISFGLGNIGKTTDFLGGARFD